jgi:hypothetical protein
VISVVQPFAACAFRQHARADTPSGHLERPTDCDKIIDGKIMLTGFLTTDCPERGAPVLPEIDIRAKLDSPPKHGKPAAVIHTDARTVPSSVRMIPQPAPTHSRHGWGVRMARRRQKVKKLQIVLAGIPGLCQP